MNADDVKVKLFADGANLNDIAQLARDPRIQGFTTNPTLMRQAGVENYRDFAFEMLKIVGDRPVSFEVFSDEFEEMDAQAREIASWGENVFVKIPVTNTKREFAGPLIESLSGAGIQLNITAVFSLRQVEAVVEALSGDTPSFVSVFAGRIADSGQDPVPYMKKSVEILKRRPLAELIWASPRELLNIVQAAESGCHIITATAGVLKKLPQLGKDLEDFSLETVEMFRDDAVRAGYTIDVGAAVQN